MKFYWLIGTDEALGKPLPPHELVSSMFACKILINFQAVL